MLRFSVITRIISIFCPAVDNICAYFAHGFRKQGKSAAHIWLGKISWKRRQIYDAVCSPGSSCICWWYSYRQTCG